MENEPTAPKTHERKIVFCFFQKVWPSADLIAASTNYAMRTDILRMEIGKIYKMYDGMWTQMQS